MLESVRWIKGNIEMQIKRLGLAVLLGLLLTATACGQEANQTSNQNDTGQKASPTEAEQEIEDTATPTPTETPATPTPTPTEAPTYYDIYMETGELPSLHERYADSFSVGIGLGRTSFLSELKQEVILQQYNSITCGNEMKADYLLDHMATRLQGDEDCPVLNFSEADAALQFCMDNGLKLRGHTLVWHSQVPRWFFTEGYSTDANAPFVTKERMLTRMENYIRLVMEYVNTTYPGVVYAWDVVNEAVDAGNAETNGYRSEDSYWYQVVGEEFLEKAFEYARKYAEPDQLLFYNDFNTHELLKRNKIIEIAAALKEKGLIDGIGLQTHVTQSSPSLDEIENSIRKYAELGLQIHITELDVDVKSNTEEDQAKLGTRYRRLFFLFESLAEQGIPLTNVTLWGLSDESSWLSNEQGTSYPSLFTRLLEPKPAFFGAMQDESVPLF